MEHKLTFEWTDGRTCAADNMIRVFKENNIPWYRDQFFNLCASLDPERPAGPVEYYQIDGRLFGIAMRPMSTFEYFHLTNEELYADRGNGYTKEDCMILDSTELYRPFCETLLDALEMADYSEKQGYETVLILRRINNHYAVIARGLYR